LVQRPLDGAHHVHRAFASFGAQEVHLVQANAMFARAGAAQAQGAADQLLI
jgi:tRNA C32,U32 (ribose-2'-O)-methylase TrmJ